MVNRLVQRHNDVKFIERNSRISLYVNGFDVGQTHSLENAVRATDGLIVKFIEIATKRISVFVWHDTQLNVSHVIDHGDVAMPATVRSGGHRYVAKPAISEFEIEFGKLGAALRTSGFLVTPSLMGVASELDCIAKWRPEKDSNPRPAP